MKSFLLLTIFLTIGANSLCALDFKITGISGSVLFSNYTSKITLWYNCDARVTLSTSVYLSEDTIYSGDDNLIYSEHKTFDNSTTSGWVLDINAIGNVTGEYIIVRVNGERAVSEVNYLNNTMAVPVTITEATYDISVYQINGSSHVIIGNELSLVPYFKNLGDIAYPYDVSFYLSKDTIKKDESDVSLGNYVSSSPIRSGEYKYTYIKTATDTLKGMYYVLAIADPENKVDEVNEENNLFYKAVNFVEENFEQKAYSIENVSKYNSAGGEIEFSFYHSNIGTTVPANSSNSIFTTAFYISLDSVFSSEDRLIGSKKGSVTSPGSRGAVVVSNTDGFVIPDSYMDTDSVYLICILDSEGTLVSNDRSNDTIFTKVYLNAPIAIVDVRDNNFNPHFWSNNIYQGVSYNYHNSGVLFQFKSAFTPGLNVMNSGTLPASVHVAMYLSEDTILGSNDILIRKADLGIIGAREAKNPALSVDLSALGIVEGNYYLFYVENPDRLYDDLAIDNDTFYYPFCYKAAPLVDYFFEYSEVGPVEVEPGDTLSLRFYEMSNLYGYRSAGAKVFFSKDSVYDALDIEADYGRDIALPDDWTEDHVFVIISLNHDRLEPEEYYFNNFSIHKLSVHNPVITSEKGQAGKLIAKIYPTIAKDVVNIDLNTNEEADVVVRNAYGAVLMGKKIYDTAVLDIAGFISGIYFIDILQGNTRYCWKIIKE